MVEIIGSKHFKTEKKMRKITFFAAVTLVLVAVGCSKDNTADNGVKYVSELKINFAGTRVDYTHDSSGLKFAWVDGEEIKIWEDKNADADYKVYRYSADEGVFRPAENRDEYKLEVGKRYFATPYEITAESISVVDGKSVAHMELEPDEGCLVRLPMISDVFEVTAQGAQANMHHIVGIVEIPVKAANTDAKLLYLALNSETSGSHLTGFFDVSPIAPYTHALNYDDDVNYESIYYPGDEDDAYIDLSTTEVTSIFVPVFPGTYSTIDLEYELVDGEPKTIKTDHELVVERGKITKISEFTLE